MDAHTFLFYMLAGLTGLCAIAVVVTQNIVRAAAWLLFTLGGVAGILFLLGAEFVGATQLLVYVGGTLVLVVFGVMLTAQGPFITMKTGSAEWAISAVVGLLLFSVLAVAILAPTQSEENQKKRTDYGKAPPKGEEMTRTTQLGLGLLGVKEVTPKMDITGYPEGSKPSDSDETNRKKIGYLLAFEIVSVHLLVVLIGAAYLARAKRRRREVS